MPGKETMIIKTFVQTCSRNIKIAKIVKTMVNSITVDVKTTFKSNGGLTN